MTEITLAHRWLQYLKVQSRHCTPSSSSPSTTFRHYEYHSEARQTLNHRVVYFLVV
ncbi:hypothetical protein E2C01_064343 [Portunus trituberculatus]|uniref:Uncharacterized protein n=1 Tax=Portunus trituberculatus TaxID=210409 RepID=A0A5B7HKJ6_PORTR|nr:hypothetical protein [Portunus trituberculatus]